MSLAELLEGHFGSWGSDLAGCGDTELGVVTAEARSGIAWLEGLLTRAAREAARREEAGGSVVASELLRGDGEVSRQRADALAARAKVADTLPGVGQAIACGAARPENADAVAAAMSRMSPTERARLGRHDADLARRAATDSPEQFGRHLAGRARDARDCPPRGGLSVAEREKAASHVTLGRRPNGRWWLSGDLDAERGAVVNDRIRARARVLAGDQPVTPNHMAQALYDLVAGRGDGHDPGGRARMGVGYIVDAATLFGWAAGPPPARGTVSETWGGEPVDPAALRRLACDTDLYAILIGVGGEPRGSHRTHRSASRGQRLSLRALYPTCPIDGVTPFERCEIHHVNLAHARGGPTELANLVPISGRWHHRIHDLGWSLTMRADRTLELRSPDGRLVRCIPPPEPITRQRE